jgi:hypothetical protein
VQVLDQEVAREIAPGQERLDLGPGDRVDLA